MERFEIITKNDQVFVLVPAMKFENMQSKIEYLEDLEDIRRADEVMAKNPEFFPMEFGIELCKARDEGRSVLPLWRKYRGFTQKELAAKCSISQAHLSDIETGRKSPSIKVIKKLVAILNMDIEYFLG